MKLSKKKVFTLALAVCLIAILSMSSLAWFTDDDSITNDFYVGDSDTPADKVFGIEVWEDRDTNGDGDYNEIDDAQKADGLKYEAILPGEVLSKEPYLENTGIHPQFVRAIVTVSDAHNLRGVMGSAWGNADLFLPGTPDTWVLEDILHVEGDQLVYVYYYTKVLEPGTVTDKIFTDVVIPTELTKEIAAEIDNFQVKILGQAIQSEHLGDPAAPGTMVTTAQRAFELYWDAEGTIAGYTDEQILANGKISGEGTTDVYFDVKPEDTSDISITGETISVTEAIVKTDPAIMNTTVLINHCNLTVADGAYIACFGSQGGQLVVISPDTTINGVAASDWDKTELMKYFHNIGSSMVWIDNID